MAVNSDKPKLSNPGAPAGPVLDGEDTVQQEPNCSQAAPREPSCSAHTDAGRAGTCLEDFCPAAASLAPGRPTGLGACSS